MKKRLLSAIVTLCMLLTMVPTVAFAAESTASGNCGDNVTWSFDSDSGILTISGEGAMDDYSSNGVRPWNSYATSITKVVFNEGLTHIGARALQGLTITEVKIPASVTSIDPMGFGNMTALSKIEVANDSTSYKSVDGILFSYDGSTLVKYPAMLEGDDYVVPSDVQYINAHAFSSTQNLTSITLDDELLSVGNYAFQGAKIENINIPDSVTTLGEGAFTGQSLKSVSIGKELTKISYGAFQNCTNLKTVTMAKDSKLSEISSDVFRGCTSLESVNLPQGLEKIGATAFMGCTSLESVAETGVSFSKLSSLGNNAFSGCVALEAFPLSADAPLTVIGSGAFYNTNIEDFVFPTGLTQIGTGAFQLCPLKAINLVVDADLVIESNAFYSNEQSSTPKTIIVGSREGTVTIRGELNHQGIETATFIGKINTKGVIAGAPAADDSVLHTIDMTGVTSFTNSLTTSDPFWHLGTKNGKGIVYVQTSDMKDAIENGRTMSQKKAVVYAVTNGGTFAQDTTFTAGVLSEPSKDGYKFDGWYTDSNCTVKATTVEAGKTYYANWIEKTTPEIAISATPETLTGGGSVELTVTGVPSEGTVEVTCDNGISVTATETAGKYTAQLPNTTKDYTFTAAYAGDENYNEAKDTCTVSVTRRSSGSSSGSTTTTNTISASTASNGKVSLDKSTAKKGDTVTVTVTPDAGYELGSLTVKDAKGNTIATTKKGDNQYTFTMPDGKVTVVPTFTKVADENPSNTGYTDVADKDWYADAVAYVTNKGLMSGTGDNKFSPNSSTTRGMLMTVLARYAGADTTGSTPWYQAGMEWAKANGVSDGTNPIVNITREQLVTMLYRYAGSPSANGSLSDFSDASTVSSYAVSAMQWAVENGIVNGSNGKLNPKNNATRAEVAAILMRYCEMGK